MRETCLPPIHYAFFIPLRGRQRIQTRRGKEIRHRTIAELDVGKRSETRLAEPHRGKMKGVETLKTRIIPLPVLALLEAGRTYMIDADASLYQLRVTLLE